MEMDKELDEALQNLTDEEITKIMYAWLNYCTEKGTEENKKEMISDLITEMSEEQTI